jgi:hypothetical protein
MASSVDALLFPRLVLLRTSIVRDVRTAQVRIGVHLFTVLEFSKATIVALLLASWRHAKISYSRAHPIYVRMLERKAKRALTCGKNFVVFSAILSLYINTLPWDDARVTHAFYEYRMVIFIFAYLHTIFVVLVQWKQMFLYIIYARACSKWDSLTYYQFWG